MATGPADWPHTARAIAALAIAHASADFPDLQPCVLDVSPLADSRDQQLATAIHRATLQRWLTLEHLLNGFLRQPCDQIEPPLRAILLTAAAQLLLFDRLPDYAVVDEAVELSRQVVRPGAAGLVNAVLRRVAGLVDKHVTGEQWVAAADCIPVEGGHVKLRKPCLPDPKVDMPGHLGIATSHPMPLVKQWYEELGEGGAIAACMHGIVTPPTIVAVEEDFDIAEDSRLEPHDRAGFVVWRGPRGELAAFLDDHPERRVQDPGAAVAVRSLEGMTPAVIVDYCAGRGTKSRQLAAMFPDATVIASDTDADRLTDLRMTAAHYPNLEAVYPGEVRQRVGRGGADILLLDVPCTNTAVLARRPEARYRYSPRSRQELATIQRGIIDAARSLIRPGGTVLYSTCSLLRDENEEQAEWCAKRLDGSLARQTLTMPGGSATAYHDGGYFALIELP